jgi:flagellin
VRILDITLSIKTQRHLDETAERIARSLERFSTGLRVNRAAEDLAAFAVPAGVLLPRVKGFEQARRNAQDAISYLHTAESGMEMIDEKLQRMRVLATQAASETYTSVDRAKIQTEIDQLIKEIDRVASATEFNRLRPLTGQILDIHVGAGEDETLAITVTSVTVTALGISGLTVTGATNTNAEDAITSLDAAMSIKLGEESLLGSMENRLSGIVRSIGIMRENEAAAASRIRDLDFAEEMMSMTRNQILQQTGLAMLAQANAAPQAVLTII